MRSIKINPLLPIITILLLSTAVMQSCKSGEDKKAGPVPPVQGDTATTGNEEPAPVIASFRQYRLDKTTIVNLSNPPIKAKKIILRVSLDDLKNPTSMRLWLYPAKDHKDYGRNQSKIELQPYGAPVAFNDTKDIIIGNNEISFKALKKGGQHTGAWEDFDYLLFIPARNGDNLVFKVVGYLNNKIIEVGVLPAETNPCPPAKPEDD